MPDTTEDAGPEAERQVIAAAERYREVAASMQEAGRPESGQHVAVKAVGRAASLVSFALRHAADSGVSVERLAELTGWEPKVVAEALERAPEPGYLVRLAPPGLDPHAVAQAAASHEEMERLQALTRQILADAGDDRWSPAPADLADLHERLDTEWRAWRQALGRRQS